MPVAEHGVASEPLTARQSRARYRRILSFAARQLSSLWWWELVLPRIGLVGLSNRTRPTRVQRISRQFAAVAVELGGLLIKLGQFLSTRLDVLPPEITRELAGLQDEVPPVPFDRIRALAESELGRPLDEIFAQVDNVPLAAASLGQVHRARLHAAEAHDVGFADVVIKMQRPGIGDIVEVDIAALERVARWLSRIRLVNRRADTPALMAEFAATCREEIDYLHEAVATEEFAELFADNPRVDAPRLVWERCSRRVLVAEDVTAIKVSDIDALRAAGIDPAEVANVFATVMFDQVLSGKRFHADPHPGNVFVHPGVDGEANWRFVFIDFGMMGVVPPSLGRALRSTFIAAATRDGAGMVQSMNDLGVLMPSADTLELERALSSAFARFGGMGFAELSRVDPQEYLVFAREFGELVRALPFQFPENMLLVLRALSLTSGVCSTLNPAFNIWDAVEPYSAKLIRAESGNVIESFARDALRQLGVLVRLPARLDRLTSRLEAGQIPLRAPELERRTNTLERSVRRAVSAMLFAGLFVGGLVVEPRDGSLATWLFLASAPPLLHALFAGMVARRNGL
ncbi:MAG TPA: AarF/UbiB family protein [Microbacteriaceae bacterium]|nr:AarF/UbiB family protein [Microbacteriaceae bacterium]